MKQRNNDFLLSWGLFSFTAGILIDHYGFIVIFIGYGVIEFVNIIIILKSFPSKLSDLEQNQSENETTERENTQRLLSQSPRINDVKVIWLYLIFLYYVKNVFFFFTSTHQSRFFMLIFTFDSTSVEIIFRKDRNFSLQDLLKHSCLD